MGRFVVSTTTHLSRDYWIINSREKHALLEFNNSGTKIYVAVNPSVKGSLNPQRISEHRHRESQGPSGETAGVSRREGQTLNMTLISQAKHEMIAATMCSPYSSFVRRCGCPVKRCLDSSFVGISLGLSLGTALVVVFVQVGKVVSSEIADLLDHVLVQRSCSTGEDDADFRVHLGVAKQHAQRVPGSLVDVQRFVDNDAVDAGQANGSGSNELLDAVDAGKDDIGVGQVLVLVAGVGNVDGRSRQFDAGVVGDSVSVHPDKRVHVIIGDDHELVRTSKGAGIELLLSDGSRRVSALVERHLSADLHDSSHDSASSGDQVVGDDAEDAVLAESIDQTQLLDPQVCDSQTLKSCSHRAIDSEEPFEAGHSDLPVRTAWEALVQSNVKARGHGWNARRDRLAIAVHRNTRREKTLNEKQAYPLKILHLDTRSFTTMGSRGVCRFRCDAATNSSYEKVPVFLITERNWLGGKSSGEGRAPVGDPEVSGHVQEAALQG
ncbi:hypothetical protein KCU83_g520, partial [Aureobasidium melanogenum]